MDTIFLWKYKWSNLLIQLILYQTNKMLVSVNWHEISFIIKNDQKSMYHTINQKFREILLRVKTN